MRPYVTPTRSGQAPEPAGPQESSGLSPRDIDEMFTAAFYGALTGLAIGLWWLVLQLS